MEKDNFQIAKDMSDFADIMVQIPEDLETVKLPSPQLLEYYRLRAKRVLSLYDGISEDSVFPIIEDILRFNEEDKGKPIEERQKIIFRLSSPGGDPDAAMSLASTIQLSKTPIVIINMCDCYSAAFLILIAAKERYGLPYTNYLWHAGSLSVSGGTIAVTDTVDFLKKYEKIYEEYIIANTGIDKKAYARVKKNDYYMTTEEAMTNGVITGVVTDIDDIYN